MSPNAAATNIATNRPVKSPRGGARGELFPADKLASHLFVKAAEAAFPGLLMATFPSFPEFSFMNFFLPLLLFDLMRFSLQYAVAYL